MKRLILILLTCAMLVGCLASCNILDPQQNAQSEEPQEGPNKRVYGEDVEEEISTQLSDYLRMLKLDYGLTDYTFENQINSLKDGRVPIFVNFSPKDCYYVCAYYNISHDVAEGDGGIYCCVDNYTWVKFNKSTEIPQRYNDQEIIIVFQINRTDLIMNLLSEEIEPPIIQHFQMFEPEFIDGFNIKNSIEFSNIYIYLYGFDRRMILFSASNIFDRSLLIDCVFYENEYYVSNMIKKEISGKNTITVDLVYYFGEHYDYLTDSSREKIYVETNLAGVTTHYLLTDLNSFINIIK